MREDTNIEGSEENRSFLIDKKGKNQIFLRNANFSICLYNPLVFTYSIGEQRNKFKQSYLKQVMFMKMTTI